MEEEISIMCSVKQVLNLVLKSSNTLAVFDFDYTLTRSCSNSSIGVFSNYLPSKYCKKKKILDYYTEKANSKILYYLIWKLKLKLLSNYYSKDLLNRIDYRKEFILNDDMIDLLLKFKKKNIDILIYSSGIHNIIVNVLKTYNISTENINILANKIDVETKKIETKIVTPKKKRLINEKYDNIYMFGDKEDDLKVFKSGVKILIKEDKLKVM